MRRLSKDLRRRIVTAYFNKEGSYAELGKRFAVSKAVVEKLVREQRRLGTLEPPAHLRGRKPAICGAKQEELREHLRAHPDATLRVRIKALGLTCTINTLWKTLRNMSWRSKKSLRAAEQARQDVAVKRRDWQAAQEEVDSERLVFVDETGLQTNFTRLQGWALGGRRLVEATPGDLVVLDNLSSHKSVAAEAVVQVTGASFVYWPPCSYHLNPIETLFAKIKQIVRGLRPRNWREIIEAAKQALLRITFNDIENAFLPCGYAVT